MIAVLRSVRFGRLVVAALAGVAAELCALGLMAAAAWLIARAAQQPPIAALGLAIVAVRGFAIFRGVFRYVERLAGHDVALRAVAELRSRVYATLVRRPGGRDGDALSRMVSDVDSVQDLLLRCVLPASAAAVVGGASIALCGVALPAAGALLAVGLVVAGVLIPAGAAVAARRLGARTAAARSELAVRSLDLVDGARELAAFGAMGNAVGAAERAGAGLARTERQAAAVSSVATGLGILLQGLTSVAVTLAVIHAGLDSVPVAVLALAALAAFEVVLPLGEAAQRLAELRPAAHRVAELLSAPDHRRPRTLTSGDIRLAGVRVIYDAPALDGIDLSVPYGRSVAVVGASGAGKSTLFEVIAGLVEPDEGVVEAPLARGLMQDAHVFHTSIRANLLLAKPDASDAQLAETARLAGLLHWIESMPERWETVVGAGGRAMSGGQRQRLLLARALLADPPVLLLDEPTESLDAELAASVLHNVLASRTGRTTIVVTHQHAHLPEFDEVITIDRGRIAMPACA
jgi:ATP-binding cassette, subfamily C, bacterial CydC